MKRLPGSARFAAPPAKSRFFPKGKEKAGQGAAARRQDVIFALQGGHLEKTALQRAV